MEQVEKVGRTWLQECRQAMDTQKTARKTATAMSEADFDEYIATNYPALVPRPDGCGALLSGGVPGNRGGTGRPSSEVRARCRGSFDERIPMLEAIIDDPAQAAGDHIRAAEVLARYGLGTNVERNPGDEKLEIPNVIVLPMLQAYDPTLEYVEEEVTVDAPPQCDTTVVSSASHTRESATVDPELARAILEKRRNK